MRSLLEIQQIIHKLARPINPPAKAMPTYDNFRYDGTPNIEVSDSVYYYRAFAEHGELAINRQATNLAKLLYWVFEDITRSMAYEFAEKHRTPSSDFRKIYFEYQLDLLEKVNHEWKVQRQQEIEEILADAPYRVS
jgi:hypothetical protein